MGVTFTNAVLLPLLALALVPLILHLFARTRPPVFPFSSVAFIRRVVKFTQRIKRPQDWLLWLLRTLAVLGVVAVFLKPLLFTRRGLGGPHAPRNVIVIVDASASMGYIEGAQSRFAVACAEAAEIVGGLSSRDTANLIWLRSPPRAVFPRPGVNFRYLRDSLQQARVSNEAADVREALRLAMEMLRDLPGKREICILSDFQRTNWTEADLAVPPEVDLIAVKIGRGEAGNTALTRIHIEPGTPLAGEAVTAFCEVNNFSPRPRQTTVYLQFGEIRDKQDLRLDAWGKATAAFALRVDRPGEFPLLARLSEDEFAADNARQAIVEVRPFLRIGLLAAEAETADAWRRALGAVGWAKVEPLTQIPTDSSAVDVLLLAGWDGAGPEKALACLAQGTALLWYPAPGTPLSVLQKLVARDASSAAPGAVRWESAAEPYRLAVSRPDDPAFAVFRNGEFGDPARGVFKSRLNFAGLQWPNAVTLLEYQDRVPALVRGAAPGALILWNLPLQAAASDWAARPEFLPLLAELVLASRASDSPRSAANAFFPGQRLVRALDRDALAEDVRLVDANGARQTVERRETEAGVAFVSARADDTGLFTWYVGDDPAGFSVVSFPAQESDLRTRPAESVAAKGHVLGNGRDVQTVRAGLDLWPHCLAAVFALGLMELLLANWSVRT